MSEEVRNQSADTQQATAFGHQGASSLPGIALGSIGRLPEFYLYLAYPLIVLSIMLIFPRFNLSEVVWGFGGVRGPIFFFLAGPPELKLLFIATLSYVPWRAIEEGFRASSQRLRAAFGYGMGAIALYGCISVSNLVNVVALTYLAHEDPERVKKASFFLMDIDRQLWGGFPVFQVQRWVPEWLGNASIDAYLLFSSIGLVTFFATMLSSVHAFRRFICAMMLWNIVALPLWYSFPAVSPDEFFRQKIFGDGLGSAEIHQAVTQLTISPALADLLSRLSEVWSDPTMGMYAVSSFPSFHVGGYILLAYGLFLVHRATLLIMAPLCLLNTLGALYTLQHYLVDFLPAIALSVGSIAFVERYCPVEPNNRLVAVLYYPIVCAQQDLRRWAKALPRLVLSKGGKGR